MNYQDYLGDSYNAETGEFDPMISQKQAINEKDKLNVLLMGASGVGKSSLVNAIFGMDIAKVGVGKPVTQQLEKISVPEKGLVLWDTKGIEAKDFENTKQALEDEIEKGFNSLTHKDAPHIALLCIKETSKRIEDRELELIELTKKHKIPTIVVFTQTQYEDGEAFFQEAQKIINEEYQSFIKNRYIRVNSLAYKIAGHTIPQSGLEELVDAIYPCLAEGHKNAEKTFAKIQAIRIEDKYQAMLEGAKNIVHIAAVSAGGVGASPIPGSDAPIIAAIQSTMLYKLNSEFEVDMKVATATSLITGSLGMTAVAQVGKTIVANAFKFIPGAGSILGGVISAATATAITEAIGFAYIEVLKQYFNHKTGKVEFPDNTDSMLNIFKQAFEQTYKK